jgi:hypothetical protein
MAEESSPSAKGNAADEHPPNQAFAATQANLEIDLPPNDDRGYRYVRLTNGLECVLISDTMCDVTAAAMDVGVGSLADPENFQGCAHFWWVHGLLSLQRIFPTGIPGYWPFWTCISHLTDISTITVSMHSSLEPRSTGKKARTPTTGRSIMDGSTPILSCQTPM